MTLALFVCAVLAELLQPGVIMQSPAALFARTERTYKDVPTNFMGQLMVTLFRIGTVAMSLCVCFFPTDRAPFAAFWAVCAVILAVILVKMVANLLLDYTFSLTSRFGDAYELYGNFVTLSTAVLYPVLLVMLRVSDRQIALWTFGGMAVLFVCVWFVRAARTYVTSFMAVIYLLLYVATMEILPMAALIYLSAKTIMIL